MHKKTVPAKKECLSQPRRLRVASHKPAGEGNILCSLCGLLLSEHDVKTEDRYGRTRACIEAQDKKIRFLWERLGEATLAFAKATEHRDYFHYLSNSLEEENADLRERLLEYEGESESLLHEIFRAVVNRGRGYAIHLCSRLDEDDRQIAQELLQDLKQILPKPRPRPKNCKGG